MDILPVVLDFTNINPAVLPVLIFFARIVDVSMGTMRIILISRGMRLISSIVGFFEVFIWLVAIGQIMQNISSIENYIAYAAGFASGTYVGMTIERQLAISMQLVRIIVPRESSNLVEYLIDLGYRITFISAQGARGEKTIIYLILKKSQLSTALNKVKTYCPDAFYSIENVRLASETNQRPVGFRWLQFLHPGQWFRKSK